jgi:hypothetical protein
MKPTAMALAFAFALSSTCAFAHTGRPESNVRSHSMYRNYRNAAPSAVWHPKCSNPNGNFSGYGSRDVWGHWAPTTGL